jgi:hypothetical protein
MLLILVFRNRKLMHKREVAHDVSVFGRVR